MVGHEFKYGTSHSSLNRSVFYGDDVAECAAHFVQQFFVQRFEESQIIVGDASSRFGLGTGDGTPCFISDRSYADDSYIFSVLQFPSFAYRNFFKRAFPVHQYATATRIAEYERTFIRQLCRVHQSSQLMLIHRGGDGQIRYRTQISHVERTVMCRTVFAYQSGTVETENYGKILNSHIMDNIVISPLHER